MVKLSTCSGFARLALARLALASKCRSALYALYFKQCGCGKCMYVYSYYLSF